MHLIAYAYAIAALLALLVTVLGELRRARRTHAMKPFVMPKDESATSLADLQNQTARQHLQAACRSSAKYQLAQFSLGRNQLEQRDD